MGPHEGGLDAFIRKYDAAGNVLWGRQIGTNRSDHGEGISADGLGNVYIAGRTTGGLGGNNLGSQDAFLSKYTEAGSPVWTRQLGTNHNDTGLGVAADSIGNIYMCGTTFGNLGGEFNSANADAFVTKYDSSGSFVWTRLLGTPQDDTGNDVALDVFGNIYLTGHTTAISTATMVLMMPFWPNSILPEIANGRDNLGRSVVTKDWVFQPTSMATSS
jgi:hypothetical protein